ncbi:MAG: agmatine deiminase family protein, partial [bacterium]
VFPDRRLVPINCEPLVWGMGTIHCVSQQQPKR